MFQGISIPIFHLGLETNSDNSFLEDQFKEAPLLQEMSDQICGTLPRTRHPQKLFKKRVLFFIFLPVLRYNFDNF